MKLFELIADFPFEVLRGSTNVEITSVVYDSRKVTPGSLFVCISGARSDGHQYAEKAVDAGAVAVVCERNLPELEGVTVIRADDSRRALSRLAAVWFGMPSEKLKVIGVTGTKGKTATTYMIKKILDDAGIKTGLIGTIESVCEGFQVEAENTTPESYIVQEHLAKMWSLGCTAVVMEVSSQALKLDRVADVKYEMGLFTNLEPDHISPDEHADFDEYLECKSRLFKMAKNAIVNADSEFAGRVMDGNTCSMVAEYGMNAGKYRIANVKNVINEGKLGISYELSGFGTGEPIDVTINVPGEFNAYNTTAAILTCVLGFGVDPDSCVNSLRNIKINGRVESVDVSKEFSVLLDYAHNGMALENVLSTLRKYNPGRLVCMFGCGGNRARDRRFDMGEISAKLADFSIITSDNPRYEDPEEIIRDILTGFEKGGGGEHVTISDRREAIRYAIANAKPGDLVVIAGKGHETYQEIAGVKHHMDDREMILGAAKELGLIE